MAGVVILRHFPLDAYYYGFYILLGLFCTAWAHINHFVEILTMHATHSCFFDFENKLLVDIFTCLIVPVVLISLCSITAGIKDNDVNVNNQPIAWPQPGYLYLPYDSGEYVTNWKMKINCKIKIKSLIISVSIDKNTCPGSYAKWTCIFQHYIPDVLGNKGTFVRFAFRK